MLLRTPYGNSIVVLHGILSQLTAGAQIQVYKVACVDDQSLSATAGHSADAIPDEVWQLLDKYSDIFASKVTFPPTRVSTHSIPLLSGATPIHIRPYRYTPALKDEIDAGFKKCSRLVSFTIVAVPFHPLSCW
jgi:hypothetical protein